MSVPPSAETLVIVTAGPTQEWIDPVRYISNASSGRMGTALAAEAYRRGYTTILVHGPLRVLRPECSRVIPVETTVQMADALTSMIREYAVMYHCIALFMAAAPADYRCAAVAGSKIKKSNGNLVLELVPNPDILKQVAQLRETTAPCRLLLAGFAAETDNCEEHALRKLREKDLDFICLNDVTRPGAGFDVVTNEMTVYERSGRRYELALAAKEIIAGRILDIAGL